MKELIKVLKQRIIGWYCYRLGNRIIKKRYEIALLQIKLKKYGSGQEI